MEPIRINLYSDTQSQPTPDMRQAMAHAEMGEELKALVVLHDPEAEPLPDELISWCRERLTHYKCPRSVAFCDDLGRNTMGKVNKRTLRAPYCS